MIIRQTLYLLMCAALFTGVAADDKLPNDQVSFQVDVDQEVENDRVNAVLSVHGEEKDPARLADDINTAMQWALDTSKKESVIKVKTGSYQTYPVYSDKKIVRWRGRQDLLLEASDISRLSKLVGTLQTRLQIQSMQFSVAQETQRAVQDELIKEALTAFKKRADLVANSLGAKGYEIVTVSLHTSGHGRPPPIRMESMRTVTRAAVEAPAMEAGASRVSVQAACTIQLNR